MTQVLRGNIVHAPKMGELSILEHGYMVLEDGVIRGVYPTLPEGLAQAEIRDYGDRLLMQSFADMHLHAPQYPMLGMGMDLPLLDWLNTYTFPTEARFADLDYARRVYRRLATDLITNGTTRVCMFSSLHTDATLVLMDELERAGVTGYVGKVNMDRNGLPGKLQESTEESVRETLRWLDACHFEHIKPILTPRFTPSCTDELMTQLGKLANERGLYVQSHLSESTNEIAWVKELHPECSQYWETYDKYGLWKDHTLMAHCVHSDARECAAIRRAGVLRYLPRPPYGQRGPVGHPGQRYRRRRPAAHVQGHHHVHPYLQGPPCHRRAAPRIPDRGRGLLPGHHLRPQVFRGRGGLRRGR